MSDEDQLPDHRFVKKIQDGKKNYNSRWTKRTEYSEKSVYTLHEGAYKYRKKQFIGVRVISKHSLFAMNVKNFKPIVFIPNFGNFILDHHVFVEKLLNHDNTYFE